MLLLILGTYTIFTTEKLDLIPMSMWCMHVGTQPYVLIRDSSNNILRISHIHKIEPTH
jgi:hypothetical protein